MNKCFSILSFIFSLQFLVFPASAQNTNSKININITESGSNIASRFEPPKGYVRRQYDANSFAAYLRNFPLKQFGAPVLLHDGTEKARQVHASVFDMPILKQDLIQCADAVIKLRAEYLYQAKRYHEIQFHITSGMLVPFSKYAEGFRPVVSGTKVTWKDGGKKGYDREIFDAYLKFIYTYAGTYSLSKESKAAPISEIKPGDFFIYGGTPGHAVLVLDVAENAQTGEKMMLLGQSYMPSQEFHILKSFDSMSPWYSVKDAELITPEWTFEKGSLRKF